MQQYDRFKDAPWMQINNLKIVLGGVGGIGSNALYCLTKSIPNAQYFIYDSDTIDEFNIGTQFFNCKDVGLPKVNSIRSRFTSDYNFYRINSFNQKITEGTNLDGCSIVISAFDNMKARKVLFDKWCASSNRDIFIDGRLRATYYEVYAITEDGIDEYKKTLFDDDKIDEGPCTFKATTHFGMLIGARICHILTNYLSNKFYNEEILQVPFLTYELGDSLTFQTSDKSLLQ